MNLACLLLPLLGAVVRPARTPRRAEPATDAPLPRVPRQARRHLGDWSADLSARDYSHWRVVVLPGRTGVWVVAAFGAHLVRAPSVETARRRIHEIETAPPPHLARPYLPGRP